MPNLTRRQHLHHYMEREHMQCTPLMRTELHAMVHLGTVVVTGHHRVAAVPYGVARYGLSVIPEDPVAHASFVSIRSLSTLSQNPMGAGPPMGGRARHYPRLHRLDR
jgi:hypothetical protein